MWPRKERSSGSDRRTEEDNPSADPIGGSGYGSVTLGNVPLIPYPAGIASASNLTLYSTGITPPAQPTKPAGLDIVRQDDPVRAYKSVRVYTDDGNRVLLVSHHTGEYLKPTGAKATCRCYGQYVDLIYGRPAGPRHSAPQEDCTCGWYAMKAHPDAHDFGLIVAEVDLYGRIIEAEHGYRAEYQRILSLTVKRDCRRGFLCDEPASVANFTHKDAGNLVPSCEAHAHKSRSVPLSRVAGRLGLEVRWADA